MNKSVILCFVLFQLIVSYPIVIMSSYCKVDPQQYQYYIESLPRGGVNSLVCQIQMALQQSQAETQSIKYELQNMIMKFKIQEQKTRTQEYQLQQYIKSLDEQLNFLRRTFPYDLQQRHEEIKRELAMFMREIGQSEQKVAKVNVACQTDVMDQSAEADLGSLKKRVEEIQEKLTIMQQEKKVLQSQVLQAQIKQTVWDMTFKANLVFWIQNEKRRL